MTRNDNLDIFRTVLILHAFCFFLYPAMTTYVMKNSYFVFLSLKIINGIPKRSKGFASPLFLIACLNTQSTTHLSSNNFFFLVEYIFHLYNIHLEVHVIFYWIAYNIQFFYLLFHKFQTLFYYLI